jgi:hypothetical protein
MLADTSCGWHTANYPSVNFGVDGSPTSIQACFKAATQTLNSIDGQFRGIIPAAGRESAVYLDNPAVVSSLITLPLACEFDSGDLFSLPSALLHRVATCGRYDVIPHMSDLC